MKKILTRGLMASIPVAITIVVLRWVAGIADSIFGTLSRGIVSGLLSDGAITSPLGALLVSLLSLVIMILVLGAVGTIGRFYIGEALINFFHKVWERIPFIRNIYSTVRQAVRSFGGGQSQDDDNKKVVMVTVDCGEQLGLLAAEGPTHCWVLMPNVPPTSLRPVRVESGKLRTVNVTVAEAMTFFASGGTVVPEALR